MSRWPKEAAVLCERRGGGDADYYEAVDIVGDALRVRFLCATRDGQRVDPGDGWYTTFVAAELPFLRPLTPTAEAMLAIARAGRRP